GHVDVVLDEHRYAFDRAARAGGRADTVALVRLLERVRGEAADGSEGGVVAGDALQVRLDDGATGHGSGVECVAQLGNGKDFKAFEGVPGPGRTIPSRRLSNVD